LIYTNQVTIDLAIFLLSLKIHQYFRSMILHYANIFIHLFVLFFYLVLHNVCIFFVIDIMVFNYIIYLFF